MARVKAVTNVQSRLFQFWIFLSLIYGAVCLVLGIDLLTGGGINDRSTLLVETIDVLTAAWTIIYLWFLFQTLVFARESGDPQIRRPFVWVLLSFLPISNVYTALGVYPRIIPPWIKRISRISVSPVQVLAFMLINVFANLISRIDSYETLTLSLLADGIAGASLVWVLRDVLLGKRAS